jgi:hypothetical protein
MSAVGARVLQEQHSDICTTVVKDFQSIEIVLSESRRVNKESMLA